MNKNKVTDSELLDAYIESSGLKIGQIVEELGISRQAFHKKRKGETAFRSSEVFVLCNLLNITDLDTRNKIFYPIC